MNAQLHHLHSACFVWLAGIAISSPIALADVLHIAEMKACQITCAAGSTLQESNWASGRDVTPAYWGRQVGDAIVWETTLKRRQASLIFGLRYSYAAEHYQQHGGQAASRRVLFLTVDQEEPIEVAVPDTSWWDLYELTSVALPPLKAGKHVLRLESTLPHATTNVDCFVLYDGSINSLPGPLRATQFAESASRRYVLRATPRAKVLLEPEELFAQFDRIYEHYRQYMGWAPAIPITLHLMEPECWDSGATAYQNQWGVFLRADAMRTEQGNWCHEMTHMFYEARFPGWFDESSVKMLTTFEWAPALYPAYDKPEDNPYYRQCVAEGRAVLDQPKRQVDSIDAVQYALRLKYGADLFRRFFHLCAEAGEKEQLEFRPGRHLTKAEIVQYMSQAAGEDVGPLYRQWRGFADAP